MGSCSYGDVDNFDYLLNKLWITRRLRADVVDGASGCLLLVCYSGTRSLLRNCPSCRINTYMSTPRTERGKYNNRMGVFPRRYAAVNPFSDHEPAHNTAIPASHAATNVLKKSLSDGQISDLEFERLLVLKRLLLADHRELLAEEWARYSAV